MKLPQFTMRDLAIGVTLICIGVGMIVMQEHIARLVLLKTGNQIVTLYVIFSLAEVCFSLIGMGLGAPFKRKALGGLLGTYVMAAWIVGSVMLMK